MLTAFFIYNFYLHYNKNRQHTWVLASSMTETYFKRRSMPISTSILADISSTEK